MAIANAVAIRQQARQTTHRALAARVQCAPGTLRRSLGGVDRFAAILAALNLQVVTRP